MTVPWWTSFRRSSKLARQFLSRASAMRIQAGVPSINDVGWIDSTGIYHISTTRQRIMASTNMREEPLPALCHWSGVPRTGNSDDGMLKPVYISPMACAGAEL
jgi:hypothetical protein